MWADEPLGHGAVVQGLWNALRQDRLPHALLFEGRPGIGKFLAACWFAEGIFCASGPGPPCGACGPCKRVAAGSHPDIFLLDPVERELETIGVHSITEREGSGESAIETFLALRPMEGGWRVVVVREIERATAQAQNALLKMLEEPGQEALLVLETSRRDLLLETVLSRCVRVRLEPLGVAQGCEVLARQGVEPDRAETLVRWGGGSPGSALLLHRQGAVEIRGVIAGVLAGSVGALQATAEVTEVEGAFPGRSPAARTRARARFTLDLALSVLRDGLRSVGGIDPTDLAHGDLAPRLGRDPSALADSQRELLALRGEVELNLPPEGILDRAFLSLSRAGSGSPAMSSR